jgi:hypothetical protein
MNGSGEHGAIVGIGHRGKTCPQQSSACQLNGEVADGYVERKWGSRFRNIRFINDHHNYLTVVVVQRS